MQHTVQCYIRNIWKLFKFQPICRFIPTYLVRIFYEVTINATILVRGYMRDAAGQGNAHGWASFSKLKTVGSQTQVSSWHTCTGEKCFWIEDTEKKGRKTWHAVIARPLKDCREEVWRCRILTAQEHIHLSMYIHARIHTSPHLYPPTPNSTALEADRSLLSEVVTQE